MKKILKNYIACIIIGAISILAAILFAPIWNWWESCPWKEWGTKIIYVLVAILIILYLIFFLAKKIKSSRRQVIKVLTIIEFTLLSLIALGCILSQFNILGNLQIQASQIFALALWTRGVVELFRAYYYRSDSNENYPVWYLAISIAMTSLGTYFFAKPLIQDIVVLWIFVALLFFGGILLLALGINLADKKPKKIKSTVSKSTPNKVDNKKSKETKIITKTTSEVNKNTEKKSVESKPKVEAKKVEVKKTTTEKKPAIKKTNTSKKSTDKTSNNK